MKRENGITLIALIITIVILVILTAITINNIMSSDLFGLAKGAAENYIKAGEEEQSTLKDLASVVDNIGYNVERVKDKKPGELEQLDDNTFVINSIEDLVVFSHNVTNGNTYEGKTVKLGLSLDFNSDRSYVDSKSTDYETYGYTGEIKKAIQDTGFIPIGALEFIVVEEVESEFENSFKGTFDGDGNKIYNLSINYSVKDTDTYHDVGFFTGNSGTIKNLGIENGNVNISFECNKFCKAGMLVGTNASNGTIENCYTTGVINVTLANDGNTGGFCGNNAGIIKKCFNKANLNVLQKNNITTSQHRIGGVIGCTEGNSSYVEDIYNKGNITVSDLEEIKQIHANFVGGAIGFINASANYSNNIYSTGEIKCIENNLSVSTVDVYGGVIGNCYNATYGDKCFYLKDRIYGIGEDDRKTNYGIEKSKEDMKDDAFLDLLNQDNPGVWKKDTGINDGYPLLSWQ